MIELLIGDADAAGPARRAHLHSTNMMHANDKMQEQATQQTESRATFTTLTSDIRQAFVGDGTDPILSASATSITFESPDRYPDDDGRHQSVVVSSSEDHLHADERHRCSDSS